MPRRASRSGFTLIEILIVLGITGILATIVIIAINPSMQLRNAKDAERKLMIKEQQNAILQFIIGTGQEPVSGVPFSIQNASPICRQGITDNSCVSLDALAPEYLGAIPQDASASGGLLSGYGIYRGDGERLLICSSYLPEGSDQRCPDVPAPDPVCGNGSMESGEQCDDGNAVADDGCGTTCDIDAGWTCDGSPSVCHNCGNGAMEGNEQCDDENLENADGCDSLCQIEACGNGIVQAGEDCDDGNTDDADGCAELCTVEAGYGCIGSPSVCHWNCGDGDLDAGEQCDDGNADSGDGCTNLCVVEIPGVPDLVSASDTGASQTDNITNDTTPTFNLSCLPGATVTLRCNNGNPGDVLSAPTTCTASGTVLLTASYDCGSYQATQENNGYTSTWSVSDNIRFLTSPGVMNFNVPYTNQILTDPAVIFGGAGNYSPSGYGLSLHVTVREGETEICSGDSMDSGGIFNWSCNAEFAAGEHQVTATMTDMAGNVSEPYPKTFTVSICGDSDIHGNEQCDDGNTDNGDGCSSVCLDE